VCVCVNTFHDFKIDIDPVYTTSPQLIYYILLSVLSLHLFLRHPNSRFPCGAQTKIIFFSNKIIFPLYRNLLNVVLTVRQVESCEQGNKSSVITKGGKFHDHLRDYEFVKKEIQSS
jgi:hypothetical protein